MQIKGLQKYYQLTDNYLLLRGKCEDILAAFEFDRESLLFASDYTKSEKELIVRRDIEELEAERGQISMLVNRTNQFLHLGCLWLN